MIAQALRHTPEAYGIKLDSQGYTNTSDLLKGINHKSKYSITFDELKQIVAEDEKQRYSFKDNYTKIRANQGHSVEGINPDLKEEKPPVPLYPGTASTSVASIKAVGIKPQPRQYVHLSKDKATAEKVGRRHGYPVIFEVDTESMYQDGHIFYVSENGVWLTKEVPAEYIKIVE